MTYSSKTGLSTSGFLNKISIPLGVQLWSVKNDLARGIDPTLEKLAATGFRFAEAAGYDLNTRTIFGLKPAVFRQKLDAAGIQCIGAHAPVSPETIHQVLEDLSTLNIAYLICSLYPDAGRTAADYYQIAENYNHTGGIARKADVHFGYHNHHFEFTPVEGERPIDILLKNTDPALVSFELDLGWAVQAGTAPETLFETYPGRFPLWHLRDVDAGGTAVNAGAGIVNFHALQPLKKQAGFLYGIVETPSAATDGMDRVIASFNYIRREQLY
ncbi:sugar phosphate isomerase/epimerase [Niabella sp. CC-SYL272]|uniref:sugar phosphate isomerase/epimerase family protein n=1 Tax=Niabella agricola TaxID=2891571 RepID=UPI001F2C3986|nr:sugar phosphate isomerase/epimerase [Niabella agricola]MCF3110542.1 sugar phosphate isomerase/epimerase [Niabella agricola]